MTWQLIETAPKDGTHVLLYIPNIESAQVHIGWFVEEETKCYGKVVHKTSEWRWKDGFMSGLFSEVSGLFSEGAPTHWMPLPEPPVGFV
jgi:hypothetical protein